MGHLFLLLLALLLTASAHASTHGHGKAAFAEVSGNQHGYSVVNHVTVRFLLRLLSSDEDFRLNLFLAGQEHRRRHRRDRVEAAELRGEVQVLRPLRGGAGAHIPSGAAEEEEARPWQPGCCCCRRRRHRWKNDAGLLRRPLQLQAAELEMQVWAAHLGPLKRTAPIVRSKQNQAILWI